MKLLTYDNCYLFRNDRFENNCSLNKIIKKLPKTKKKERTIFNHLIKFITAWNESEYGVISGPYFSVFSPNTEKYGPEITPYLDTFHAVYEKCIMSGKNL